MTVLLVLSAGSAAAGPTITIDFEGLAPGTVLGAHYHFLGVDFRYSPTQSVGAGDPLSIVSVPAGQAHSGTQIAAIGGCSAEVCGDFRPIWAHFPVARHLVSVYVGGGEGAGASVQVAGMNAAGGIVASQTKVVGAPTVTQFQLGSLAPIVFLRIAQVNTPEARAGISIDDLSFDSPDVVTPDFGLARDLTDVFAPNGDVTVVKGHTATLKIFVNRFNGATGNLKFSIAGLPSGVTASFLPGTLTSATAVTVTLTAATGAPTANATLTVTADPLGNKQAGPSPRTISFPFHVLGNYDLSAVGIEVTQGVQTQIQPCSDKAACSSLISLPHVPPDGSSHVTDYAGVLLVKHAITVARVFGRVNSPVGQKVDGVTVALHAFRNGTELAGSPLISSQKTLKNGWPWATFADRADPNVGWGFTLPDAWTEGTIKLKAEVVDPNQMSLGPAVAECETSACKANNFFTLRNIPFGNDTGHITLSMVRLSTQPGNYWDHVQPFPKNVLNAAERLAPLAPGQLRYPNDYEAWIDISDLVTPFNDPDSIRAQDSDIADRLEDWIDDNPACEKRTCADQTMGVYTNVGYGLSRGKLLEGDEPVSVVDSNKPLKSVAHELAHGWGRAHASYACGGGDNGQVAEGWPPDEQGYIQGIGTDVRAGTGGAPGALFRVIAPRALGAPPGIVGGGKEPMQWYDFMSYCAGNGTSWISTKGWDEEVSLLQAIEILHAHPNGAYRRADSTLAASKYSLRVRGFVKSDGKAMITSVKTGGGLPIRKMTSSPYHMIVRGASGSVLSDTPMQLTSTHLYGVGNVLFLVGAGQASGAISVQITRDGLVIGSRMRSAHAPLVKVLAPKAGRHVGAGRTAQIRWHASDADGDRLSVRIDYSLDGGKNYTPLYEGPNRGTTGLPSGLLSRSSNARIRLTVNDGFNTTTVVSAPFTAVGRPPHPRIVAPLSGLHVDADETIQLAGTAYDDRQRLVPSSSLRWFDGRRMIGRGRRVSVNGLRAGLRTIRLVARDRFGRLASSTIRVHVRAVRPRFLVLVAPHHVRRSAKQVALRLSTNVPAVLHVGRMSVDVDRSVRTVTVRVRSGKRPLHLTLRLEAGSLHNRVNLNIPRA